MGLRCGMRTTKCQLLMTSLCVMLLGLSIATLSTVTHYGLHFTLFSNISLESNGYRVIHHAAFYFGICLSMTLILAALLSSAATVRESQRLTAMGFFCFALAFLGLIPAACWRYTHSTEVEESMMDVYDLVYEEVRRNASSFRRHELTAIHETVSFLSALAENLALKYLLNGFSRLGLMPVLWLVDAAMPFSLGNQIL
uniref:Tetraspanin 32 n=1 Tax=Calidris pygmaea TaxID=425635 RepID=A0A8C3KDN1_9CHAR